MVFGKNSPEETSVNAGQSASGFLISPLVAVIVISLICGCMVGAYFLGFRAGHTNGLELALANNLSQVVRSPIAKLEAENAANVEGSADIYAKLKEPLAVKNPGQINPIEVSKEVKDFLEPTSTPKPKAGTKVEVAPPESVQLAAVQEKKQADTAAIERALSEAKRGEENLLQEKAEVQNKAVRVIGGPAHEASESTQNEAVNEAKLNSVLEEQVAKPEAKEDFSEPPTTKNAKVPVSKGSESKAVIAAKLADEGSVKKSPSIADQKKINLNDSNKNKEIAVAKAQSAKEAPAKLTASKDSISASGLPAGWYSQVSAPRSIAEAQNISSKLRSAGFKSRIETAEVRDQKYFRVVVGPESSRTVADQVLMRLKKQTIVKTEPFIRMVR